MNHSVCGVLLVLGWLQLAGLGAGAGPVPAESACQEFAKRLEASIQKADPSFFDNHYDGQALVDRALADLTLSAATKKDFAQGFLRGQGERSFGKNYASGVEQGGQFELLRIRQTDNQPCALFRITGDQGLNYLELALASDASNRVVIADLYIYVMGEWLSRTLRRSALPLVAQQNRSVLEKLSGTDNDFIKNMSTLQRAQAHLRQGEFDQAWRLYNQLPASLQEDKLVLVQKYTVASKLGDQRQSQVLEQMYKTFPRDPCMSLLMIDGWLLKTNYTAALGTIDRLDQAVGTDPYLDVMRANVLLQSGAADKAGETARRAAKNMPRSPEPLWTLVTISLHQKQFAQTAQLLTQLQTQFNLEFEDLSQVPVYAEFVKSKEYAAWQQARARKP